MKIRSWDDITRFTTEYPRYSGHLVAALLKSKSEGSGKFGVLGPNGFAKSATFLAAMAHEDLAAQFDETNAEHVWAHWIAKHDHDILVSPPADPVLVDWKSGVFRHDLHLGPAKWSYGKVADIAHGLYDRKDLPGRQAVRAPVDAKKNLPATESSSAYDDIHRENAALAELPETTRKALVDARLGQGKFRNDLIMLWAGKCSVTKCANRSLLRASHIKPWRDSTNLERLDRYNGLLLSPTLDAAFDRGLITFSASGEILFRSDFDQRDRALLGLNPTLRLICVYPENLPFLAEHRRVHGFTDHA